MIFFIFGRSRKLVEKMIHLKRKIGVSECPRSLNPGKTIAMAICPIIVHFITWHGLDVQCEFVYVVTIIANVLTLCGLDCLKVDNAIHRISHFQVHTCSIV